MVDDLARPTDVEGLEVRSWIRDLELAVDAVFVERAGPQPLDRDFMPASGAGIIGILCLHRMGVIEHKLDAPRRRCPESEGHAVRSQLRAKAEFRPHAYPAKIRTERGAACIAAPAGNRTPLRGFDEVSSRTVHSRFSASAGKVNIISSAAALSTM